MKVQTILNAVHYSRFTSRQGIQRTPIQPKRICLVAESKRK